jgi:hypothetical protein
MSESPDDGPVKLNVPVMGAGVPIEMVDSVSTSSPAVGSGESLEKIDVMLNNESKPVAVSE